MPRRRVSSSVRALGEQTPEAMRASEQRQAELIQELNRLSRAVRHVQLAQQRGTRRDQRAEILLRAELEHLLQLLRGEMMSLRSQRQRATVHHSAASAYAHSQARSGSGGASRSSSSSFRRPFA